MAVSARSAALRSVPGAVPRPSTTAYQPPKFTPTPVPQVAPIDDARAPNAASRAVLQQQYGAIPGQLDASLTGIKANAQQRLAGYGGYKFRQDDPNTPEREDLILDFDAGMGLGEREKAAVRDSRNQSNASGMLYSSLANQNQAQAVQRLSLEAQGVANQYAQDILGAQTNAANQQAQLVGQWTQLYGQDAAWLIDNPPPTPDPLAGLQKAADGAPILGTSGDFPDLDTFRARYPGYPLGVRAMGNGGYAVVIGPGGAQPKPKPAKKKGK